MITRLVWWWNTLLVAWALRGMSEHEVRGLMAKCFPHRDAEWRDRLVESARLRNRARTMRKVDA